MVEGQEWEKGKANIREKSVVAFVCLHLSSPQCQNPRSKLNNGYVTEEMMVPVL